MNRDWGRGEHHWGNHKTLLIAHFQFPRIRKLEVIAKGGRHPDFSDGGAQTDFVPKDGTFIGAFKYLGVFECADLQASFARILCFRKGFSEGVCNF